jgi:hypothetical protein
MIFRTRVPQPVLTPFIEFLWFYQDLDVDHTKEKLLPDASMELIIDLSEGPKRLYDNRDLDRYTTYNRCWISGLQPQFIVLGVQPGSSMMGAHFRTGGAAPFFGFPLSELSGNVVELDLIWKERNSGAARAAAGSGDAGREIQFAESLSGGKSASAFAAGPHGVDCA